MGTGMPDATPLTPILIEGSMGITRLHAEARFGRRTIAKNLRVAAPGALRASTHVWQITTCERRSEAVAT